jgi:hypothetical protein
LIGGLVAFDGELHARAERTGVAPRHEGPGGDGVDAGQLSDPPRRFLIEGDGLRAEDTGGRRRDVDRQHVLHVVAGVRGLQRDERGDEHAGAGQQHEREGDLRRRENTQAAIRVGRDAHAAGREAQTGRCVHRRQSRDVGQ